MITDLIDVESFLGQHDPGMIMIGPVLSLSINSRDRYFYVAGYGSKVYETISLGFVGVDTNADKQRTDFIEKLQRRFAEVLTFGSHLEMAHAVHTRWPNEETATFLAVAELEATLWPTKVAGQQESIDDDGSYAGVVPGDRGKQLVDEVAPEPADRAKGIDDNSTDAPPWARDKRQPTPVLRPTQTLVPSSPPIAALSQPLRSDRAVTEQPYSELSQDDIASAILRLESPAELRGVPRLPVKGARSLASIILRFCAIGCAVALVAAIIAWAMVRPSAWQVADKAAPAPVPAPSISVSRNNDPLPAEATMPPSDPNYVTEANEPALRAEPGPATVPPSPPSQPSPVASATRQVADKAAPTPVPAPSISVSRNNDPLPAEATMPPSDPNYVTEANEPALRAEPGPATVPPSPPSQPSPVASATRQVADKAAPAPVPPSISVSRNNDPLPAEAAIPPSNPNYVTEANEPALRAEPGPATVPPSPPSQPSPLASAQAGAAQISGAQSPPAQVGTTDMRLDAGEIATLVSRGTDFMKSGNLSSARLLLRRAAEAGSASAALMLGTTFDPLVLHQLGAIGVAPDVAQARQWYEKAAALGSDAASQRLAKLPQTGQ